MSTHQENTRRIIAYLSYLRDISRRIVSKTGFEKCLLNKGHNYAVQFETLSLRISEGDIYFKEISQYNELLNRNHDKKLFFGFGTIVGKRTKVYAAPLLLVQCDVIKEEGSTKFQLEPDIKTLTLNYDLISTLSNNTQNDEDDDWLNPLNTTERLVFERIENRLSEFSSFDISQLNKLSEEVFEDLQNNVTYFKDISYSNSNDYDFKKEIAKYINRGPAGQRQLNSTSVFDKELKYFNANHFFVNNIPDQLSTFEALNHFVKIIKHSNDFKNPIVEKLLINALTENRVEIKSEPIETQIQEIVRKLVPLSLSGSQLKALTNAWSNEISYIQGPPGTGKSHTISAIVLSAIAENKKVLVVSQKTAALSVVNSKIDPYLSDESGIMGICYYDKNTRRKIKNYCNYLLSLTTDKRAFSTDLNNTQINLKRLEETLSSKLKELEIEQSNLHLALKEEREYKLRNDTFLTSLQRVNNDYYEIPKGFAFKKIANPDKYESVITRLGKFTKSGNQTLASLLYVNKFKRHLKSKFQMDDEWLADSALPYFSKEFINLNLAYTEALNSSKKISIDTNSIRKRINNLNADILNLKKTVLKFRYKLNILGNIHDRSYQLEIEKFDRMLYNTSTRIIDNKMQEIDFKKVTDVIPFWTAEIRNLGHLFPLKPDLFDLVIVDEASQVNLAEILPAFYRGKKICIVGDHNQLSLKASGLNFSLSKNFDELTWEKYNGSYLRYSLACKRNLTVTNASILDFIRSEDYNAIIREVMLDEHFRSLPHLARYTSREFYRDEDHPDGRLKIMTEVPDKLTLNCFQAIRVDGKRERNENGVTISKVVHEEALEILDIIKYLSGNEATLYQNKYLFPPQVDRSKFTIGVISMIRDQCEKVKELVEERLPAELWSKFDLMIGTPEEFQGNERDIMIFSLCLDENCTSGQGHYQDSKRLNVATSRAKHFTYFVYSPFPRTFDKIYKYLRHIKGSVDEDDFSDELREVSTPSLPPLNFDLFESDFERYVFHYLERFVKDHSTLYNITIHNQVHSCGQKRLDFVLYNHSTKRSVAIEVDGSYHFVKDGLIESYSYAHVERIEILKRAGWNIINTPYHKWYKNGWLTEETDYYFKSELDRIYGEMIRYLF